MPGSVRLASLFAARYGHRPDGVWTAPGRVTLLGEHTDYHDGLVLAAAIDLRCAVAVRRRTDGVLRLHSEQFGDAEPVERADWRAASGWSGYPAGTAWALGEEGVRVGGADILVDSGVPAGARLGSSSALSVAVGLALIELAGRPADPAVLAAAAFRAETDVVGVPVGPADQLAAVHGRDGHAILIDCRSRTASLVPCPLRGLNLTVIDVGVEHSHATGGAEGRLASCEQAADRLYLTSIRNATEQIIEDANLDLGAAMQRRARHVVTENGRAAAGAAALTANRPRSLRRLFAASHASLRDDYEVSGPELDLAVAAVLRGGAVAARMTGGFGGAVIALVPDKHLAAVTARCAQEAEAAGHPTPTVRVVVPSRGAHRLS